VNPWYYAALLFAIIACGALGHAAVVASATPGAGAIVPTPVIFDSKPDAHRVSCWRDGGAQERTMVVDREIPVGQYGINANMIRMQVPADDKFKGGWLYVRIDGCITQDTQRE
jgi:hypothetical protein